VIEREGQFCHGMNDIVRHGESEILGKWAFPSVRVRVRNRIRGVEGWRDDEETWIKNRWRERSRKRGRSG
jgi:hypothetical protein